MFFDYTDASNVGIGEVLLQVKTSELVVTYFSKTLCKGETV